VLLSAASATASVARLKSLVVIVVFLC